MLENLSVNLKPIQLKKLRNASIYDNAATKDMKIKRSKQGGHLGSILAPETNEENREEEKSTTSLNSNNTMLQIPDTGVDDRGLGEKEMNKNSVTPLQAAAASDATTKDMPQTLDPKY